MSGVRSLRLKHLNLRYTSFETEGLLKCFECLRITLVTLHLQGSEVWGRQVISWYDILKVVRSMSNLAHLAINALVQECSGYHQPLGLHEEDPITLQEAPLIVWEGENITLVLNELFERPGGFP